MSDITSRKIQHLDLAQLSGSQTESDLFSNYLLPYSALPEINLSDVQTKIKLLNKEVSQPLIISSMTGGENKSKTINTNLAIACEQMKVAFGLGSMRIALENKDAEESFKVARKCAPTTFIFANMGAVQLNYGHGIDSYKRVVDMVQADALYLHLNPLQESIQPEGNTNWEDLIEKIADLIGKIEVPVFVKEVGHGLDPKTAKLLIDAGAKGIDSAGVGGTSWAWIESKRVENENLQNWFKDFGYPTDYLIPELTKIKKQSFLVASGGIRNPVQGLKSHLLGADLYAVAQPFLAPALESPEAVIKQLQDWQQGLKTALFSIGAKNWEEARNLKLLAK